MNKKNRCTFIQYYVFFCSLPFLFALFLFSPKHKMVLAVLLPVTSRMCEDTILANLDHLAKEYLLPQKGLISVYFGIDKGDPILDTSDNPALSIFEKLGIKSHLLRFVPKKPASICGIWRELACRAYEDNCEYFILLGDDVEITTINWVEEIISGFKQLHTQFPTLPFGFGCIALNDIGAVGFPTFPVVHRVHLDIFGKKYIVPEDFINQDGDPFLFQLYKSWGASKILSHIIIRNSVGGLQLLEESYVEPRYDRIHILWRFDLLQNHITKLQNWMESVAIGAKPSKKLIVDVITPTYRVNQEFLQRIVNLEVPSYCETMFILVVDNPKADIRWLRELEKENLGLLRVRKNPQNLGASGARNVGLGESAADWIIFLDDDVIPDKRLLYEYAAAIVSHGDKADGFAGNVILRLLLPVKCSTLFSKLNTHICLFRCYSLPKGSKNLSKFCAPCRYNLLLEYR